LISNEYVFREKIRLFAYKNIFGSTQLVEFYYYLRKYFVEMMLKVFHRETILITINMSRGSLEAIALIFKKSFGFCA